MKINIRQKFLVLSIIILLVIGVIGCAVYKSNQKLVTSEQRVQHTVQVINLSGKILSLSMDIETASRGFVITGDSAFQEPLFSAEKIIFATISQLRQFTGDDPAQQQRLDSLSGYVQKHLDFSRHANELRSKQGLLPATVYISTKRGKQYQDHIRQIITAIEQKENMLLAQQKQTNEGNVTTFNRLSVGSFIFRIVFTILLLVATGNYLLQIIEKAKRAQELIIANKELAFQNEEKEKRAAELTIANKELLFQNEEKEKRAAELIVTNKELKKYFDEIIAKEALLTKVERLAHIGSWQNDLVTNVVTWADEAFRIYGYLPGEITPSREAFMNSIHPDDRVASKKAIDDALASGTDHLVIGNRVINKDNSIKYVNSEMFFERDATGKPVLISGFVQDVTPSKLADEKLRKSQGRLLASQSIGHVGSWEIPDMSVNDPVMGSPLYWSDEVFRIFGMEPSEADMTTTSFMQMVHPDDRDAVNLEFKKAFDGGKSYSIDHRIIHEDKTERFIHERGEIICDPITGKRLKMIGTVQDITDRKKTGDAIVESEERYRLVADNPMIGIGWTSLEGKILYVNDALCKMLGYTPDELHNVYFGDFTFPGDMEVELPLFEKLISGEIHNYRVEKRYITKAGTPLWAELNLSLVTNASGFQYLIGIIQNINDRKKAEDERKIAESERKKITADLIQRNSDLEQFTYIVSHNLRAPVANIIGFSEAIFDEVLGEDERKEVRTALYDSAHRLDEVVHDLNSILKVKSESGELKELVNLPSIVDSIKINNSHHIKKANAIIITDFTAIDELFSLKSYIHSIFYNLISNGIKYRRTDVNPVIEIKSARQKDKIILSFRDNGLGIDLAKRGDQVFGFYKRFHKHVEGKGVGLFMVKTQVETLGGKISVTSEVDKGTEFRIEFNL